MRVVSHFSCGAASAVATKLAIQKYGAVEIFRCDTGTEHADNDRFQAECEQWFGQSVNVIRSDRYKDCDAVFEARQFLVSPHGAPCTGELKKLPWMQHWQPGDLEIFGYTSSEAHRLENWKKENFERSIECPLIDRLLTKDDCFAILARIGIELPAMYKLGFRNNNCIGCVKARDSVDYWKRIRKYFPQRFAEMAAWERKLDFALNRITIKGDRQKVFLDEIEPGDPKGRDPNIQCGLFCSMEAEAIA